MVDGRARPSTLGTHRPGQVRKSQASTAFAPHTEPHQRQQQRFARALAQLVDHGVDDQHPACAHLRVIKPGAPVCRCAGVPRQ